MNTPTVTHEKSMEQSIVDSLHSFLPEGDYASISVYVRKDSVTWVADRSIDDLLAGNSCRAASLAELLEKMANWPDCKAAKIAKLEAELAVLKGDSVEVSL